MSTLAPTSDVDLLGLLRAAGPLDVSQMAAKIEVTPTAVRQRLARLMAQGLIDRQPIRAGRGRPRHRYHLTRKGLRLTGSNFTDLALALWKEIRAIQDPELRRRLVSRVAKALARGYADQVRGRTTAEKMESLREVLQQRQVPFSVDTSGPLPVLCADACPYHELAEQDRAICSVETWLFSELLGENLQLAQCRLDGAARCRFQPASGGDILDAEIDGSPRLSARPSVPTSRLAVPWVPAPRGALRAAAGPGEARENAADDTTVDRGTL